MPTVITCPSCGKRMQAPTEPAPGSLFRCSKCDSKFRYVPHLDGTPATSIEPPQAPPQRSRRKAEVATEPESPQARGSWIGFIAFVVCLIGAVGGAGYFFGQEQLAKLGLFVKREAPPPDNPPLSGVDRNKKEIIPEPDPEQNPDVIQEQAKNNVPPKVDDVDTGLEGVEPMRAKRFPTKSTDGTLLDPLGNKILDVEFSPDGKLLATFDAAGQTTLWDLKTKQGLDLSFLHGGGTVRTENERHLAFSSDGKTLVFGTADVVTVADLPAAKMRWKNGSLNSDSYLRVSPSTRYVMVLEPAENGSSRQPANIYDVKSGKSLFKIPEAGDRFEINLIFSPDDKLLALQDVLHRKIRLFELPAGKELPGITSVDNGWHMSFSGDGQRMILPNLNGERWLWNLADPSRPKPEFREVLQDQNTSQTMLSPDGTTLAELPRLWDIKSRKTRATLKGDCQWGSYSPDSKVLAYWGSQVTVADATSGQTLTVLNVGKRDELIARTPTCVAFSPDHNQVAMGTDSGHVVLATLSGNTPTSGTVASANSGQGEELSLALSIPDNLQRYFDDKNNVREFADKVWMSPDGNWIVTAGTYTTLWDVRGRKQTMVLTANDGKTKRINLPTPRNSGLSSSAFAMPVIQGWRLHDHDKRLSVMSQGTQVHYDIGSQTHTLDGNDPKLEGNKLSWDGSVAATWVVAYVPRGIEDRDEAVRHIQYKVPTERSRTVNPDERWELVIMDAEQGQVKKSLGLFDAQKVRSFRYPAFQTLSFSSDTKRLAAVTFDLIPKQPSAPKVHVWDWETGQEYLVTTPTHDLFELHLVDSGRILLAVSGQSGLTQYAVTAFDVELGSQIYDFPLDKGHTGKIRALAFDPVRPLFVSADEHGMLLIRDQKTGEPLARHKAHEDAITAVCFSADRTKLVTAGRDRTVKVWNVEKLRQGK